jgi:hypothetical protein
MTGARRLVAACFAFAFTCAAAAQAGTTGTIEGRVFDREGNGLRDATISLVSPSFTAQTRSNATGHYHFLSLYPDRYFIVFNRSGHEVMTASLEIHADQVSVCNARLAPVVTGLRIARTNRNRVVPCSF